MAIRHQRSLGPPDLELAGFALWVHGREFPDANGYWDGNWLRATAHCGGAGASVWVSGAFITAWELADWISSTEQLHQSLSGCARLQCLEPNLDILLEPEGRGGRLNLVVKITPDHIIQDHRFEFDLDQSYLPAFLRAGRRLVMRFPVRGSPRA
jgi:hypothetical protein